MDVDNIGFNRCVNFRLKSVVFCPQMSNFTIPGTPSEGARVPIKSDLSFRRVLQTFSYYLRVVTIYSSNDFYNGSDCMVERDAAASSRAHA
jgi:hypothetical protein